MKTKKQENLDELLEHDFISQYGPVLTGDALIKCLGYPTKSALRQAIAKDKVDVPIFHLKNRKGQFALSKDVAQWLAMQRNQVCE